MKKFDDLKVGDKLYQYSDWAWKGKEYTISEKDESRMSLKENGLTSRLSKKEFEEANNAGFKGKFYSSMEELEDARKRYQEELEEKFLSNEGKTKESLFEYMLQSTIGSLQDGEYGDPDQLSAFRKAISKHHPKYREF